MECYILSLTEKLGVNNEYTIIGIFENKEDIYNLMMSYYTENPSYFDNRSISQYEDSRGFWSMEINGNKDASKFILRAERQEEKETTSIKKILDDLNIYL